MHTRLIILIASVAYSFCAFKVSADPGIVVGSYSVQSNAEAAAKAASEKLRDKGFDLLVKVNAIAVDDVNSTSKAAFRVVLVPNSDLNARKLLPQIRSVGFPDAWYLANGQTAIWPDIPPPKKITAVRPATSIPLDDEKPLLRERPPELSNDRKMMSGSQIIIGEEEGVDLHRVSIETFSEAEVNVVIDGRVDEALWEQIPYYDNMLVSIPALLTPAEYETQIRLFATEKGLYVSSVMEQPPESLVKRYSRRDDFFDRDTFGVTIDASGEALVAYWFFVALGDSLSDGKVLPERRFARDWDGPWLGKSSATDSGWSVEFFLPWSMMNMPRIEGPRTIGFAAKRNVSATNQSYGWPGYSQSVVKICFLR